MDFTKDIKNIFVIKTPKTKVKAKDWAIDKAIRRFKLIHPMKITNKVHCHILRKEEKGRFITHTVEVVCSDNNEVQA